jgi:hypothetical protein
MRRTVFLALLPATLLAGCATLTDSKEQVVEVRTVLDNREVAGAGCILTNKAGRWFVNSPGRVKITRSTSDLSVDCKRDGAASGYDLVQSKVNTSGLWGNMIVSAGLGYFVDKNTGAGFDYPSTLTVVMRSAPKPPQDDSGKPVGNPIN